MGHLEDLSLNAPGLPTTATSSIKNGPAGVETVMKDTEQIEDQSNPPEGGINQLLVSRLDRLQKQLEEERIKRETLEHSLVRSSASPSMGRPWMLEWDIIRSDIFNPGAIDHASDMREKTLETMSWESMQGRKRVMMRNMELELSWMKREDEAWSDLSREASEERSRAAEMVHRIQQLEKQCIQEDPSLQITGKKNNVEREELNLEEGEAPETSLEEVVEGPFTTGLNRIEWKSFTQPARSFTLEVLEGEPSAPYVPYFWTRKSTQATDEYLSAAKKKQFPPGQGPMPERIRINARQIIEIFKKLDPTTFEDVQEPLIMIRPFKALVYMEEQIHQVHQALKKTHQAKSKVLGEPRLQQGLNNDREEGSQISMEQGSDADAEDEQGDKHLDDMSPVAKVLVDPYTSSADALEQWQVLVEFLNTELKTKMDWLQSDKCQRVSFADIWYLFKPGDEVVDQEGKQAYRVISVASPSHRFISPYRTFGVGSNNLEKTPIRLSCVHINFDGRYLGPVLREFDIPRFDGEKAVTSLRVYPMRFTEKRLDEGRDQETFREKLINRGRKFIDVLSFQKHMHYSGLTLESRDQVDGQVVIDFEKALEVNDRNQSRGASDNRSGTSYSDSEDGLYREEENQMRRWRPEIVSLLGEEFTNFERTRCVDFCCRSSHVFNDQWAETSRNENYRKSLVPEERWREPSVAIEPQTKDTTTLGRGLGEEDYVIMSYRVFGFILRSRKWAKLDISHLSNIRPRDDTENGEQQQEMAFNQLVLQPGYKNMLLSLVAQHFRDKESPTAGNEQVDIVRGKGKGLIILLHGAPGVGKTTTAEGVAELFEKPLFQITCGDLGNTAEHVENALETNFALANRWGCILLLDEADVFLAKRSPQDFVRNGLVSVFLRVLEYYAGILFLTTNRIGDFDEAFSSRIHISLHYPQLKLPATEEILQLNIRLIRERFRKKNRLLSIDEEGILAYARRYWTKHKKMRWNGRQIRNACQTALALAEFDAGGGDHEKILDPNAEVKLTVGHLKTVARAYREFMWYLNKLYKTDQDRLAHQKGLRARELDGKAMDTTDEEIGPGDSDDACEGESHSLPQQPSTLSQSPSTLVGSSQMGGANPGPAYPGGVPGNYLPAASQAQAGYGYFNPMTGQQQQPPLNPQQNAQMWQNINPALYQQYLLQGQVPGTGFSGVMPGIMPGSVPAQQGFMGDGVQRKP